MTIGCVLSRICSRPTLSQVSFGPHLQRPEQTIRVPVEVREHVQFEKTNLVRRMFRDWEGIPIALLRQMDLENSLHG